MPSGLQLCAAGALDVADGPPEWVCIVPLTTHQGARIEARDGRVFVIDDAAALVAASNAELERQRGPHPVDKDHKMTSWWNGGGPALAWATKYELRSDGIWARAEWLPEGAALITSLQYRYTSCNVWCDEVNPVQDRWGYVESYELQMKRFAGFTITNIPALEVYAMAAVENNMKKVLARLGLAENAGPDEVLAAIERLSARTDEVSLDAYVPRAEFDRLAAELATAKASLAKSASDAAEAEREQLLANALAAGKVIPATAEFYRESMKQPGGVERFRSFCAAAPEIAGPVAATRHQPAGGQGESLSPNELKALELSGQPREVYLAQRQRERERRAS